MSLGGRTAAVHLLPCRAPHVRSVPEASAWLVARRWSAWGSGCVEGAQACVGQWLSPPGAHLPGRAGAPLVAKLPVWGPGSVALLPKPTLVIETHIL